MMGIGSAVVASTLPNFIVIKSNYYSDKGYAYYKEQEEGSSDSNSVVLGEPSVFSTLVKIELKRSALSIKYVNLRFCYSNKFWTKSDNSNFIVADVDQPQEDVAKASCTLFQAFQVDSSGGTMVYLVHVQSGGHLLIDEGPTMGFFVKENPKDDQGYLSFVDSGTLIQLPKTVAFMGSNGNYLRRTTDIINVEYYVFLSEDPNQEGWGYMVEQMEDGYVQIKSSHSGLYCVVVSPRRRSPFSYFTSVLDLA